MKRASTLTLLESKRANRYFYDRKAKSTQWCHPLLFHILQLHERGIDAVQWFKELSDASLQVEGCGTVSKADIAYYLQKYKLLRENGLFSDIDSEHHLSGRLTADRVESSLANTRHVTFEVTDSCNLECAYCTYGKLYNNYDRREKRKLSTGTAKNFLEYMVDLLNSPLNRSHDRILYIGFYGGEPLLNFPFIREIVDYVGQLNVLHNRFCFSITTNGLLLEKYMDFLAAHDFQLLISLDGDEANNAYRVFPDGTPAYRQILENVTALKAKHPAYFQSHVNFNAVLHNKNSVSDIHRYFKTRFDKVISIAELNPSGVAPEMRDRFLGAYANFDESLSQVEDYSSVEKDMFIRLPNILGVSRFIDQCSGFVFKDYNDLLSGIDQEVRIPTGTCLPFSRKVFITVNGKILPCERVGFQHGLGFVDEQRVELDFEKIAERYNRYYDKLKEQCVGCANSQACQQCIFYLNIEQPNPRCHGLFSKQEFAQLLSTQVSYLEENRSAYQKIMKEVMVE